jgi:hypothetical protein
MPMRKVIIATICFSLLLGAIRLTGNGSGLARAGIAVCYYDRGDISNFPIASSEYQSLNGTGFGGGTVPVELVSLNLTSPPHALDTVPLPPGGSVAMVDSFFDVFAELQGPGGPFAIDSFFDITYRVVGNGGGGGGGFAPDGTWPIEMLSMNLVGNHPTLGQVMIRESPTLPSQGQHALHPMPGTPAMPGGMLAIDSFFDVFTELSLDGGQTWVPADRAIPMTLTYITPEPATAVLMLGGTLACGLVARRRRR